MKKLLMGRSKKLVVKWDSEDFDFEELPANQMLFYEPDVIGTQEGLEHQIKYLDDNLKSYKFVGVARADNKEGGKGEFSAIFYNSDKYDELENGTFWLSETPKKPSRGWDASLNRICTYILVQNKPALNFGFLILILTIFLFLLKLK